MRRTGLGLLGLVCWCGAASACMNDAETVSHEREFRSQYRTAPVAPKERSDSESSDGEMIRDRVLGGAGSAMVVASFAFVVRRRRDGK